MNKFAITIKNKLEPNVNFKISRFKEVIKRTKPHKHDAYFELIYLSEGAGFHWIDTQKIQITPPVVYFLSGQLHYWEMTSIPKGFVLLFKEEFFDPVHNNGLINLVTKLQASIEFPLPKDESLGLIFGEMEKEYTEPKAYTKELIQGFLQVVFANLLSRKEYLSQPVKPLNSQFRKFQHLLHDYHPMSNLKVQDIADKMNISPQNLNTICRRYSGKSASELISDQVILEAKRYILHTDKGISEISQALKFTDPSHFIKYFKKHTGETPQHFRDYYFKNTIN